MGIGGIRNFLVGGFVLQLSMLEKFEVMLKRNFEKFACLVEVLH